jgi:predicted molibdopterin-dependent oxidoreductase YjgC
MFCGIGVCFDCIVTIDGIANQRACITQLRDGMRIEVTS